MKRIWVLALLLAGFALLWAPNALVYGGSEGKVNEEIDLPIEKPKPLDLPEEEDGPTFYGEDLSSDSESLVFVVDFSCSMWGSRIAKAKAEVTKAINSLTSNFKFSVVTFMCSVKVWQNQLVEATDQNKQSAASWVNGQSPGGATGTGPAVKTALQIDKDNKLVVLLTDGAPNCLGGGWGTTSDHLNMILQANTQKAKVDVFAIQPYSDSYRQFCKDIAAKTGGKYKEVN